MAGKKRRDKYGRYRGKGGIKAYKSNLKGKKRGTVKRKRTPPGQVATRKKGMSKKKKVAIAAAVGVAALNYKNSSTADARLKRAVGENGGYRAKSARNIALVGGSAVAISKLRKKRKAKKKKKAAK